MFVLSEGFKYGSVDNSLTPAPPSAQTTLPVATPVALSTKFPALSKPTFLSFVQPVQYAAPNLKQ